MKLSVAPMMNWTDRHMLALLRLVSPHAQLYTQMIHCAEVVRGDASRLKQAHLGVDELDRDHSAPPTVLQLGGRDPVMMADAAAECVDRFGYGEVNINVGCPSGRVESGAFGAALMREPTRVREIADAIAERCAARGFSLPGGVTVKCRIGVVTQDEWRERRRARSDGAPGSSTAAAAAAAAEAASTVSRLDDSLRSFINTVSQSGVVTSYTVHAREAVLGGLKARIDPRFNRTAPPLHHDVVGRFARDYPSLAVDANGGIETLRDAAQLSREWPQLRGVMLGRAVMANPFVLRQQLDPDDAAQLHGFEPRPAGSESVDDALQLDERVAVARSYANYITRSAAGAGATPECSAHVLIRPALNLFSAVPGGRAYRRRLAAAAVEASAMNTEPQRSGAVADAVLRAADDVVEAAKGAANAQQEARRTDVESTGGATGGECWHAGAIK